MTEPTEIKTEPKTEPPKAAEVDPAVYEKLKTEAIEAATKAATDAAKAGNSQAQAKLDKVISALSDNGKSGKSGYDVDSFLEKFGDDPLAVLTGVVEYATKQGAEMAVAQVAEAHTIDREIKDAFRESTKGRPDLHNESSAELIDTYFRAQDPALDTKARMKAAVAKFDLQMEKIGAPSVEERVKAAKGSISSGSGTPPSESPRTVRERQTELEKNAQQKRLADFKAKRNSTITRLHPAE